ncbi:MAG TPA: MlaD family protein [Gemmatimonadales bacterium]|nr:MlaD family protein [Gemmatimonadales bacterium]
MASGTRREIAVGALALLGLVLFFAGTLLLKGGNLGGGQPWIVVFDNVNGLKRGSPVQISGYAVGHVTDIRLRRPGEVEVTFVLPEEMPLHSDAVIQVASVGLVGDVLLTVDPGAAPGTLDPKRPITGSEQGPGLTARAEQLSEQVGRVTSGATLILNQQTANEIHRSLQAMERMLNTYGDPDRGPTAQLVQTMGGVKLLADEMRRTLEELNRTHVFANMDTVSRNLARGSRATDSLVGQLRHTSATLDTLLAGINQGRGTLGMLAQDSGLYNDARRTSQALSALLEEIKKDPGRLTIQVKVF